MTELYFVNENEQMEINFDALELKTSPEFADKIKTFMKWTVSLVIVEEDENKVELVFLSNSNLTVFEYIFYKNSNVQIDFKTSALRNRPTLEKILRLEGFLK